MSRLKFVTEYVIYTEEQWNDVHFSDESKFNLFGCDGRRFVRRCPKERYSPQCTKSSVKFAGNSVVFSMISATGTGPLVRLQGKIRSTVYKEILKKHVVQNLRTAINQPAVFIQDNAPFQIVKSVKTFLSEEEVTGVVCLKHRHESYWECLEVTKWKR